MTLSNIKLIFLPPNATSVLQPMDMGVIHAIKCLYRVKVARKLLALIETKPNPTPKNIDLYDALIMLKQSWDEISAETVKNCFVKSGFQLNFVESIEMPEIEDISVWDELTAGMDIRGANFSDYVNVDNEISTCEMSVMQTDEEVNESEILVHEPRTQKKQMSTRLTHKKVKNPSK
jgi:hypothetical protein